MSLKKILVLSIITIILVDVYTYNSQIQIANYLCENVLAISSSMILCQSYLGYTVLNTTIPSNITNTTTLNLCNKENISFGLLDQPICIDSQNGSIIISELNYYQNTSIVINTLGYYNQILKQDSNQYIFFYNNTGSTTSLVGLLYDTYWNSEFCSLNLNLTWSIQNILGFSFNDTDSINQAIFVITALVQNNWSVVVLVADCVSGTIISNLTFQNFQNNLPKYFKRAIPMIYQENLVFVLYGGSVLGFQIISNGKLSALATGTGYLGAFRVNSTYFVAWTRGSDFSNILIGYNLDSINTIQFVNQMNLPSANYQISFISSIQELFVTTDFSDYYLRILLTNLTLLEVFAYNYEDNLYPLANGSLILLDHNYMTTFTPNTSLVYYNNTQQFLFPGLSYYPYTQIWVISKISGSENQNLVGINIITSEIEYYPVPDLCLGYKLLDITIVNGAAYMVLLRENTLCVSASNGTYQLPYDNQYSYFFNGSSIISLSNSQKITESFYFQFIPNSYMINLYQMADQSLIQQINLGSFSTYSQNFLSTEIYVLEMNQSTNLVSGLLLSQNYQGGFIRILASDSYGNLDLIVQADSLYIKPIVYGVDGINSFSYLYGNVFNQIIFSNWPAPTEYSPANRSSISIGTIIVILLGVAVIGYLGYFIYKYEKKRSMNKDVEFPLIPDESNN